MGLLPPGKLRRRSFEAIAPFEQLSEPFLLGPAFSRFSRVLGKPCLGQHAVEHRRLDGHGSPVICGRELGEKIRLRVTRRIPRRRLVEAQERARAF
eukprot:scaffold1845_cov257-Pinguiococcus_pyrenoidosus.AAC.3